MPSSQSDGVQSAVVNRYPVFSQNTLPLDANLLDRLFGDEISVGIITHPLDITDVWKTATAASSNMKFCAAKFTARHPNLVAVEFSSFKCGHDAPVYTVVERIIEQSGTPYFCVRDLDENKTVASIKLWVIVRTDGTLAPCFPVYSSPVDWGNIERPNFDREQLINLKETCQQHCFSTLNHILAYCYDDAWVIKFALSHLARNFRKNEKLGPRA